MQIRDLDMSLNRMWRPFAALALVAFASGCAANHSFVRGETLDVSSLVSELDTIRGDDEDDALYDMTYIPFAHLDLQVFAKTEDTKRYPNGHTFASIRSWLPLFGIVDGEIELYDAERAAYEKNEFLSVLWGLWSQQRTTVQTAYGVRTERNYNLFWILNSGPRIKYALPASTKTVAVQ